MSIVTDTIGVGVHDRIPFAQYKAIDALNSSKLNDFAPPYSPFYCNWRMNNPKVPTTPMIKGSALHSAILEPETLWDNWALAPDVDKRTKAGKEEYAAFLRTSAGKSVIDEEDMLDVERMRDSILAHPYARATFDCRNATELTGIWTDEETGLLCKLRADAVCDRNGILIDIKTTNSIDAEDFAKTVWNFGYWRQIPYYLHGMAELGRVYDSVAIIAVESAAPFECAVFELDPEDIERGWQSCRALMNQYQKCRESGLWPSRSEDRAATIKLPRWTLSKE